MPTSTIGNLTLSTTISNEDVDRLFDVFAYLTEDGWKIPDWLKFLRLVVNTQQ